MKNIFTIPAISLCLAFTANAQLDFTVDTTFGCKPLTVNFTNTTTDTNAYRYEWYFGDGSPVFVDTLTTVLIHTYNGTGWVYPYVNVYDVSGGYIGNTYGSSGGIEVRSSDYISFWPDSACPGTEFNLCAAGYSTIRIWDFGDTSTDSVSMCPNHSYVAVGDYIVTLIQTTMCGTDTVTRIAKVRNTIFPDPGFSFSPNPSCPDRNINFNPWQTTGTHSWSVSDGYSTSNTWMNHSFDTAGNYEVIHIITNSCGNESRDTQVVGITDTIPCVSITASVDTGCSPLYVEFIANAINVPPNSSLQWDFGDGSPYAYGDTVSHTYTWRNTFTVNLSVLDSNNNWVTDNVTYINVSAYDVSVSMTDATCAGGGTNGTAWVMEWNGVGPYSYSWSNSATTSIITGLSAGMYKVTATDSYGCSTIDSGYVGYNTNITLWVYSNPALCTGGGNNGTAWANPWGGNEPYTYVWSTSETTGAINNLVPDTYFVTVSGADGCTNSGSTIVGYASGLNINVQTSNANCQGGGNDGSAWANVSSGTSPYTYSWSTGGTNSIISGLTPGTYTITVADNAGCADSIAGTVNLNGGISINVNTTPVSCPGDSDGTASAVIQSGGTPPFTYIWSTGDSTQNIAGLAQGDYTVTVYDSAGCSQNATGWVFSSFNLFVPAMNESCGNANGVATAEVTGGQPPFTYAWSNGMSDYQATGLISGNYTVTVTDNTGCSINASTYVGSSGMLYVDVITTDQTCWGANNGTAAATSNGIPPLTYLWSNSMTTSSITGLTEGNYYVTITDNTGCNGSDGGWVGTDWINLATSMTPESCSGTSDGTASVTVSGGAPPFTYLWSNGGTNSIITGLISANYNVTVNDTAGCSQMTGVWVPANNPSVNYTTNDATCTGGGNDGSVTTNVTGGSPPFTYAWSTGSTDQSISGLNQGNYTVTVTDATGCTSVAYPYVGYSSGMQLSMSSTPQQCPAVDGTATVTPSGGTTPYTYIWSTGGTDSTITGLTGGYYYVTVTEATGCSGSSSVSVGFSSGFSVFINKGDETCPGNNGWAEANVVGGTPPYTYQWSTGGTDSAITGLSEGNYTVTVTDQSGCSNQINVNINNNTGIWMNIYSNDATCSGGGSDGSAWVNVSGGSFPYTYQWSVAGTESIVTGLTPGTYTVTVTDATGCSRWASTNVGYWSNINVWVNANYATCTGGGSDGSATANASGGNMPYTFSWSTGSTDQSIYNLVPDTYFVTVTDMNGCTNTGTAYIGYTSGIGLSIGISDATCPGGGSDGSAWVNVYNATPPYTYNWSTGGTNSIITGLTPGMYTVTVTDNSGCAGSNWDYVGLFSGMTVNVNTTPESCAGSNDGTAVANVVSGGTPPFTYSWWGSGQTTQIITGLSQGTYTVTVTDNAGCSEVASGNVGSGINLTYSTNFASCGGADGSVEVFVFGGTPPYGYSWSNGDTTQIISGLTSGTYYITVTDSSGCIISGNTYVGMNTWLNVSVATTPESSQGAGDGTATASHNGTPPFQYSWSNGMSGNVMITGLQEGSYSVTVTDSSGCSGNASGWVWSLNCIDTFYTSSGSSACPGEEISFWVNGSYNSLTWTWGDGTQDSYWNWPQHSYDDTGVYMVRLIVADGSCGTDTIYQPVVIDYGAAPSPQIFVNLTEACPGDQLFFSQPTCDAQSYLWTFGDTSTSTLCSPAHAWQSPGNYEVVLTVTNQCGNSGTDTVWINVDSGLQANATFYFWSNPCPYNIIEFNPAGSGSFFWDFGDGYSDTVRNPRHFYSNTGNYFVTLILVNGCGDSDTSTSLANVQYDPSNKPYAQFEFEEYGWPSPDTITICTGNEVRFRNNSWSNNNGPYSSLWVFGDGDSSSVQDPSHVYFTSGFYSVQLIIENSCQGLDTATKWIIADPAASPSTMLTLFPPLPVTIACPGDRYIYFIDDAINENNFSYSYSIWFGNGDSAMNITQPAIPNSPVVAAYSYPDTGTFVITFIATNSCGISDSLIDTVYILDPNPAPMMGAFDFTDPQNPPCPGDTVGFLAFGGANYLWQFPDGSTDTNALTGHVFDSVGNYIVRCIITNSCGAVDTVYDTLTVDNINIPGAWFEADNLVCVNEQVTFNSNEWYESMPMTHFWDFGDGITSTDANPVHAYSSPGVYTVNHIVTNGCGSSDPSEYWIMVDLPLVDFTGLGMQYCIDGPTANLTGLPSGGTFSGPGISGNSFNPGLAGPGTHDITYFFINSNGCPGSRTITTIVYPLPSADAGQDLSFCPGDVLQLNATGGVSYSWYPSAGLSDTSISNPLASPADTTVYHVVVTSAQGCVATDSMTMTLATSLVANAGPDVDVCAGDSVMLIGTGGGNYLWYPSAGLNDTDIANPFASPTATTTYYLAVFTANCSDTDSVVVTFYTPLSVNLTPSDTVLRCPGSVINLSSSSATSYVWNTGSTNQTISADSAGTYTVTITDALGCNNSASLFIPAVSPLVTILTATNSNCVGVCNGSIDAGVSGGTPPYSYQWDDPLMQTTSFISGLCIGTYHLTVTDSNMCVKIDSAVISQPPQITAVSSKTDATCADSCNGSASLNVSGGLPPYNYTWSSGGTTATSDSLCAGTHSITISDKKGCSITTSVVINEPSQIVTTVTSANMSCNTTPCNGSASVSAAGGIPPYSYLWSTSDSTDSISGLCTGIYLVAVFDANSCVVIDSALVAEPAAITITFSVNDVSCNGLCDGTVAATASGGTGSYSYSWSNGSTISSATGLCPGNYLLTIADGNGCIAVDSVNIAEPLTLTAVVNTTNVNCNGNCDGTATAVPSGGNGGYSYLWSDSYANNPHPGLCPGNITVTVTDSKGCTAVATSDTITEPSPMTASVTGSDVTCNGGNNGSADVTVGGGTGVYGYIWSNGATTEDVTGISAGNYTCKVSDTACSDTVVLTVSINEPSPMILILGAVNASCGVNDGSAWVNVSGGSGGYSYLWNDSLGQTNDTAVAFYAGSYCVTVTDANGCTSSGCMAVSNFSAPAITPDTIIHVSCDGGNDGEITITASGAGMLSYNWSNGATADDIYGLVAGTYVVSVTDSLGCIDVNSFDISEPLPVDISFSYADVACFAMCNGFASANISGGTSPYVQLWNTNDTSYSLTGLCAGNYFITVTDANSCTGVDSITVSEPPQLTIVTGGGNASCGNDDGYAFVLSSGGISPYSYQWSDSLAQTTDTAIALFAGNYTVIVTDANNCTASGSALVNNTGAPLVIIDSTVDVTCNGAADGVVYITATGSGSLTYVWSSGMTSEDVVGLSGGAYFVSVTDSAGCVGVNSATINEPATLVVTATANDASCNLACDGTASAAVSGGTAPYTYLWSDGSTFSVANGLCTGIYSCTVSDANGCIATDSVTVNEPSAISLSTTTVSPLCNGDSTGSIDLTVSGGVGGYTYNWSTGDNTEDVTGLIDGGYDVTVTDGNGCTGTGSATITEPAAMSVVTTVTDASCFGLCNGTATVSVSGGTPPYAGDGTTTGICAGTYIIIVTDSNGCSATDSATIIEPGALSVIINVTDISCNGICDGVVSASPTGGASPITYLWSTGASSSSINSLCPGTYTVTITDANTCTVTDSGTVTEPALLMIDSITWTKANCPVPCNDGTATVYPSGGTGTYTYLWSNGDISSTATGLPPDTFYVMVTDANGCTDSGMVVVDALVAEAEFTNSNLEFQVFPNPAKDMIEISFTAQIGNTAERKIKIFNVNGKMVREYLFTGEKISVAGLAEGIYGVKLEVDGVSMATKKVVIIR